MALSESLKKTKQHTDLNIFISLNEQQLGTNVPNSRLPGLVLTAKDNIHITELPNTAGTPALENFIPTEDAPIIRRLKAEGAVFVGKANSTN